MIINVRFKMTLWDCIKLRISGLSQNVESIDSIGEVQSISFKPKEITMAVGGIIKDDKPFIFGEQGDCLYIPITDKGLSALGLRTEIKKAIEEDRSEMFREKIVTEIVTKLGLKEKI